MEQLLQDLPLIMSDTFLEAALNTTPFLTIIRGAARFAAGGQRRLTRITESSRYPQLMHRIARLMQPVPSLSSPNVSADEQSLAPLTKHTFSFRFPCRSDEMPGNRRVFDLPH